jgi:hypothetical protein
MAKRKTEKRQINSFFALILLVFIFILIIIIICNLAEFFSVIDVKSLDARVIVSNRTGFDINSSALIFGEVMPSGAATRDIFIDNNHNEVIRIKIYSTGNISSFLQFESDFILQKNKTRKVGFSVYIPKGTKHGIYNGKVIIEVKKLNLWNF